ncbi:peptidase E [Ancylomarina salipaludis]|uniref:Peptidase E n=1 Tax=Ancylomarina salipaludis TaxID=2501299 RepID=A0A4Q1JJI6_9BACT|nr:peptidase E [Ancylomarina salipaludis]RXQ90391.1 peptidase E [Ancylomarina salipaludis]
MKKTLFFFILASICQITFSQNNTNSKIAEQTIFVYGGNKNLKFTQYIADLTQKSNPKICFLPTASADNESNIKSWNHYCKKLGLKSYVLRVWVASNKDNKSFEDILLNMDAIVVGGGNTLNMLGIWRAQGIDTLLQKALNKGIILSGGSAGSLCWFDSGISDSRPVNLSVINGMSFLPFSHCPHYSDKRKKEIYNEQIKNKTIGAGYACDDKSGILFRNGKYIETVSLNDINHSYYVSLNKNIVQSSKLPSRILVNKDALSVKDYQTIDINKKVKEYAEINNQDSPLNAFISFRYIKANGQQSKYKALTCSFLQKSSKDAIPDIEVDVKTRDKEMNTIVNKVFIYNDLIAGVVSQMSDRDYYLWFFYKEDGKWLNAGEYLGGATKLESEITFREEVKMHLKRIKKTTPNR